MGYGAAGVHDLLKIQIYRENAKIANIFCNMMLLNSFKSFAR